MPEGVLIRRVWDFRVSALYRYPYRLFNKYISLMSSLFLICKIPRDVPANARPKMPPRRYSRGGGARSKEKVSRQLFEGKRAISLGGDCNS